MSEHRPSPADGDPEIVKEFGVDVVHCSLSVGIDARGEVPQYPLEAAQGPLAGLEGYGRRVDEAPEVDTGILGRQFEGVTGMAPEAEREQDIRRLPRRLGVPLECHDLGDGEHRQGAAVLLRGSQMEVDHHDRLAGLVAAHACRVLRHHGDDGADRPDVQDRGQPCANGTSRQVAGDWDHQRGAGAGLAAHLQPYAGGVQPAIEGVE